MAPSRQSLPTLSHDLQHLLTPSPQAVYRVQLAQIAVEEVGIVLAIGCK